jgi:hypothetical protein
MCFIVKRSSLVQDHFKIKKTICFIGSGLDIYVMFQMHPLNHKVNTPVGGLPGMVSSGGRGGEGHM